MEKSVLEFLGEHQGLVLSFGPIFRKEAENLVNPDEDEMKEVRRLQWKATLGETKVEFKLLCVAVMFDTPGVEGRKDKAREMDSGQIIDLLPKVNVKSLRVS